MTWDQADEGPDWAEPRQDFVMVPAAACHGRLWLYDAPRAVLVTVDPETLRAKVHASLPTLPPSVPSMDLEVDPWSDGTDAASSASLAITRDAIWVIRPGQLVRIDPWDSGTSSSPTIVAPSGASEWTTDGDHFWATAWPSGDVLEVDARSGAQRRVAVGGHLGEICVSGTTVWVVDRTDETLLGLDAATLAPRLRVPFDGGRVGPLLAWAGGVLAPRAEEHGTVAVGVGIVDTTGLSWVEEDGRRTTLLSGGAGGRLLLDGDRLWVASEQESPVMRRPDLWARGLGIGVGLAEPVAWPDPVTTLRELHLPQAEVGRTVTAPGQAFHLAALAGRIWSQGFLRSRQAFTITAIDADKGVVGEVDLTTLNLPLAEERIDQPRQESPDDTLDRLPEAVRGAVTHAGVQIDQRTGERTSVAWLGAKFGLVDVQLEPETYDLWVIFTWADEPGRTFGYVYTADPEMSSMSTADDLALELLEDLDTGIMRWGDRDEVDGVIWISRPETSADPDA